jgi:hypothetical protein
MFELLIHGLVELDDLANIVQSMISYDLMIEMKTLPLDQVDKIPMNDDRWRLLIATYGTTLPSEFIKMHIKHLTSKTILPLLPKFCIIDRSILNLLTDEQNTILIDNYTKNVQVSPAELIKTWFHTSSRVDMFSKIPLSDEDIDMILKLAVPYEVLYRILDNPILSEKQKKELTLICNLGIYSGNVLKYSA